ncbi:three-helix bundle dimerization domain-containing protein [Lentzea flaviverrucosa]|uniref:Uncharacterized protein n=1 Tax=Lentzea flaviverrucosa TaxID=200379 RepID=A0A1H9T1Y0_9PSEU|nr:hypothetical protein [Lentzea flaviverrucosa]RDI25612.1 hypothetical protein DFR72_108310 [Lentzea flaviverrucosa]SER91148.1 hypothetical protein SAMN05216195_107310 [Lentzea flaviverrucosa]
MLNSEAQLRQAVDELVRRFGDRVPGDLIVDAAVEAFVDLRRASTVHSYLGVLTVRRAARELAFTAVGVTMPVQQTVDLTPAR